MSLLSCMFYILLLSLATIYEIANLQLCDIFLHQYRSHLYTKRSKYPHSKNVLGNDTQTRGINDSPVVKHVSTNIVQPNAVHLTNISKNNAISDKVINTVSNLNTKSINDILVRRRNKLIKEFISRNCNRKAKKEFCNTPQRLFSILHTSNPLKLKALYDSQKFISNGSICDGCEKRIYMNIISKNSESGILIRKYVGNTEVKEIYQPNNRNSST